MVDDAHGEGYWARARHRAPLRPGRQVRRGDRHALQGLRRDGGVVAGKRVIVDYLRQKARPFLFSSAVTPPDTAACLAAVDLLEESEELVEKLWRTRHT